MSLVKPGSITSSLSSPLVRGAALQLPTNAPLIDRGRNPRYTLRKTTKSLNFSLEADSFRT